MSFLTSLIPANVKLTVTAVIAAIVFTLAGVAFYKYNSLTSEISQAQIKNTELEKEKTALTEVNQKNQEFINNMKTDLAEKEKIVTDFRIQKARDNKKMDDLANVIKAYSQNEDGPIAKTLKDSVSGVQKDREERLK